MFLLTLIICQIIASSAKVLNDPSIQNLDQNNEIVVLDVDKASGTHEKHVEVWDDPLWVLKLNDRELNFTYLRSATEDEEENFDTFIGPIIHRHPLAYYSYKQRQASRRVKKDDPNKPYPIDQILKDIPANNREVNHEECSGDLKNEVIKIINKFVLSFHNQPESHQSETKEAYKTPTLTLYFKGPFTALLVNYEHNQWQFFVKPPSPLPKWFYNEHSNITLDKYGMYVNIPDEVKEEFYEKLLNLLNNLFSFPI
ncbi:unnamed protein product [Parnassius mnemosyne]|uniref:Uncharacterized protein n=1 Tax=Parnassius mnemosyne TaxID=213953 RepID=A0AAV1L6L9_9NEOP